MNLFRLKKLHFLKFTEKNALRLLKRNGFLSTSIIQYKFGVGYAKAAQMIDALEERGYIKREGNRWIADVSR